MPLLGKNACFKQNVQISVIFHSHIRNLYSRNGMFLIKCTNSGYFFIDDVRKTNNCC